MSLRAMVMVLVSTAVLAAAACAAPTGPGVAKKGCDVTQGGSATWC